MTWGIFKKIKDGFKNVINKVKPFVKDFADGFKWGWNKTKSVMEKLPVVGEVAGMIPKFDNSNNKVIDMFGSDGYYNS